MTLPTRSLGASDLDITRVGLGAWAIGGAWKFGWGESEDKQSIATIHAAVDHGINWIDTAPVYGLGHSEEVVGDALRQLGEAERPYIFTKCGMVWDEGDDMGEPRKELRPEQIKWECENSLRRLGVDRIDLFQFHWPDTSTGTAVEDSWGAMLELIDEGKVRYGGVSNFDVELLQRCESLGHVTSLQPPFSMINRTTGEKLLPYCDENRTGVICYSPMQSGILTDSFSAQRVADMDETDWRRRSPDFSEPGLSNNIALRDALKPVAERHDTTVESVAVAWTLAWPGCTAAIVGARKPEQIEGWLGAATLELSSDDMAEIAGAIERTGAGRGPAGPAA